MVSSAKKNPGEISQVAQAVLDLSIFVVAISLLLLLRFQATPLISPVIYLVAGNEPQTLDMPAFIGTISESMVGIFTVELETFHPTMFSVQVDDCIEKLAINGVLVIPEKLEKVCSPHDRTSLRLGPYVRSGENTFSVLISDTGVVGGIDVHVSNSDPFLFCIWIAIILLIGWYSLRLRLLIPVSRRWPKIFFVVLLFGAVLRLVYASATPYMLREYDTGGHLDYINYMQEHWKMPIAQHGWEFHQPPLYYMVSAGWMTLLQPLQLPQFLQYQSIAAWSLLFSIFTFTVTLFCLTLLYGDHDKKNTAQAGMILAVCSGFVFFASRITNDGLSSLMTVSTLILLLLWWKRGDRTTLIALALVFSLGFVTKISILALAPAIAVALVFRSARTWKRCLTDIAIMTVIVLFSAGWYPVHRLFFEPDQQKTLSFGNDNMSDTLELAKDQRHLFTFHPSEIIKHPFNDPRDDELRRAYLLEYFYRSAFFGEFKFEKQLLLAQSLLAISFFLLPAIILGFFVDLHRRFYEFLPFHCATLGLLLAAFLYPYIFSFASNQDFRFSVILVLPAAYYAVRGIESLPLLLRITWRIILGVFLLLETIFILSLFLNA